VKIVYGDPAEKISPDTFLTVFTCTMKQKQAVTKITAYPQAQYTTEFLHLDGPLES